MIITINDSERLWCEALRCFDALLNLTVETVNGATIVIVSLCNIIDRKCFHIVNPFLDRVKWNEL